MADSPGSPLSSHASSEFTEDVRLEDREVSIDDILPDAADARLMPPTKRQKLGAYSYRSTPVSQLEIQQEDLDISSDTSGDVPNSPQTGPAYMTDDEPMHEQVTVCKWRNCPAGDLLNMDSLVNHIHNDHIGQRQKKYACEWESCARIDAIHASGYALRAHMRSHTREKPFYCALPECDRSFTRSDALAKHMRTVHETEALRPSDPIPRSHSAAQTKPQRLKLIVNAKPPESVRVGNLDGDYMTGSAIDSEIQSEIVHLFDYPSDVQFTAEELSLPPDQLFRLLRRQVHWTEEENQELKAEVDALEIKRKEEWQAKEMALTYLEEGELGVALLNRQKQEDLYKLKDAFLPPADKSLPYGNEKPWFRDAEQLRKEEELRDRREELKELKERRELRRMEEF